jgi:DNA-directed RNA polymerase subunit RPC12/RpoP
LIENDRKGGRMKVHVKCLDCGKETDVHCRSKEEIRIGFRCGDCSSDRIAIKGGL